MRRAFRLCCLDAQRVVNSLICENLNLESDSVPKCRGIEIVIFVILNLESGTLFLHEIGNVEHCFVMNEVGFRSPELRICVICSKFRALAQRDKGLGCFLQLLLIFYDFHVFLN